LAFIGVAAPLPFATGAAGATRVPGTGCVVVVALLLLRSGAERGAGAAGTRCGAGAVTGRVGVEGVAGVRGEVFAAADFGAGFVPLLLLI